MEIDRSTEEFLFSGSVTSFPISAVRFYRMDNNFLKLAIRISEALKDSTTAVCAVDANINRTNEITGLIFRPTISSIQFTTYEQSIT